MFAAERKRRIQYKRDAKKNKRKNESKGKESIQTGVGIYKKRKENEIYEAKKLMKISKKLAKKSRIQR